MEISSEKFGIVAKSRRYAVISSGREQSIRAVAHKLVAPGDGPWWLRLPPNWSGERIEKWNPIIAKLDELGYWDRKTESEQDFNTRYRELVGRNADSAKWRRTPLHRFPKTPYYPEQKQDGVPAHPETCERWLRLWIEFRKLSSPPAVDDVAALLEDVLSDLPDEELPAAASASIGSGWVSTAAALFLAAAAAALIWPGRDSDAPTSSTSLVRLDRALPTAPAPSPVDDRLLYLEGSTLLVWTPGGVSVPIAQDVVGLPRWSPTGNRVAYYRRQADDGAALVVQEARRDARPRELWVARGPRRAQNAHDALTIDWRPNGREICFADYAPQESELSIFRIAVDGDQPPTRLTDDGPDRAAPGDTQCAYSPDGRQVAVVRHSGFETADLIRIRLDDKTVERWTERPARIEGFDWLDDEDAVISAHADCGPRSLWKVDADGEFTEIAEPPPGESYSYPTVSRHDGRIWLQAHRTEANIYAANLDRDDLQAERITRGRWLEEQPALSPDGARLLYSSRETGAARFQLTDPEGRRKPEPLTPCPPEYADSARWSHDGRIVYSGGRLRRNDGKLVQDRLVYVVAAGPEAGLPRPPVPQRVTQDQSRGGEPLREGRGAWASDGGVYLRSNRGGRDQIWKFGPGDARTVVSDGYEGFEAETGDFYFVDRRGPTALYRVANPGAPPETIIAPSSESWFRGVEEGWWALGRDRIYVLAESRSEPGDLRLQVFNLDGAPLGPPRVMPGGGAVRKGISVSRDRRRLYWSAAGPSLSEVRVAEIP